MYISVDKISLISVGFGGKKANQIKHMGSVKLFLFLLCSISYLFPASFGLMESYHCSSVIPRWHHWIKLKILNISLKFKIFIFNVAQLTFHCHFMYSLRTLQAYISNLFFSSLFAIIVLHFVFYML